jgi:tRNA pseudouridine13 synthase
MFSAARSLIFNAILAERVRTGNWNRLDAGDVANLDGRGSVFTVEAADATIGPRVAALDIHPTAPLMGEGTPMSSGEILALEQAVAARFPEALAVIRAERMNAERRALRIRVREPTHEYADGALRVRFALDAGSFATTVLREIVAAGQGEE